MLSGTGRFQVSVDFIIVAGKRYERELNGRRFYSRKGGFPLSRNFYVRTDINFNWLYVRKLETMYRRSDVNVKVERGSTFTFTRGFSYIVSLCLLARKIGLACYKFYRNFSFGRSYISRLARLVRRMNKKQSLLTIVFIHLIQHLTSWTLTETVNVLI